jgi:integrase
MLTTQALFSRFREQVLSTAQAGSSVQAYNSRLAHLKPLAEARFNKRGVDQWLEKMHKTRSQNSARELVRLAKKLWLFGIEKEAWRGANPFHCGEKKRGRDAPFSEKRFLSLPEIREVLKKAPDSEAYVFWACCAFAGLRQSEAANLKLLNLELLGSGIVRIVGLPKRGNAPDYVNVNNELCSLFQAYTPPPPRLNSLLFPNLPKHASQRTRELQATVSRSSLFANQITFNLLRLSFGANLLLQGASLETVRQQMRFAMLEEVAQVYGGLLG